MEIVEEEEKVETRKRGRLATLFEKFKKKAWTLGWIWVVFDLM